VIISLILRILTPVLSVDGDKGTAGEGSLNAWDMQKRKGLNKHPGNLLVKNNGYTFP
jgi:hypothetical protein